MTQAAMTNAIPMVDLRAQHARIRPEVDAAVRRVVESTQFIRGEDCELFEQEFAAYCGAAHAWAWPTAPTRSRSRSGPTASDRATRW